MTQSFSTCRTLSLHHFTNKNILQVHVDTQSFANSFRTNVSKINARTSLRVSSPQTLLVDSLMTIDTNSPDKSAAQQLTTTTTYELFKLLIAPSLVLMVQSEISPQPLSNFPWRNGLNLELRDMYGHKRYQRRSPLGYWRTITLLTTTFVLKTHN